MNIRTSITLVAALAALFAFTACNEEPTEPASTETPTADNPPAAEEATADPAPAENAEPVAEPAAEATAEGDTAEGETAEQGEAAGGDTCGRAAQCCEDYVGAMGGGPAMAAVQAGCANYRTMANTPAAAGCQAAIDGWRQGLTAAQHDVPASCQ